MREVVQRIAYLLAGAVVLGSVVWYFGSPTRWGGRGALARVQARQECSMRYARAHSAVDTAVVDAIDVGGKFDRIVCRDVRTNSRGAFPSDS